MSGAFRRIGESLPVGFVRMFAKSLTPGGRQQIADDMEREQAVLALAAGDSSGP